jgi:hypothetical protein
MPPERNADSGPQRIKPEKIKIMIRGPEIGDKLRGAIISQGYQIKAIGNDFIKHRKVNIYKVLANTRGCPDPRLNFNYGEKEDPIEIKSARNRQNLGGKQFGCSSKLTNI